MRSNGLILSGQCKSLFFARFPLFLVNVSSERRAARNRRRTPNIEGKIIPTKAYEVLGSFVPSDILKDLLGFLRLFKIFENFKHFRKTFKDFHDFRGFK